MNWLPGSKMETLTPVMTTWQSLILVITAAHIWLPDNQWNIYCNFSQVYNKYQGTGRNSQL